MQRLMCFLLCAVESPIDHMALKATTYFLLHPSLTCVLANEELRTTKLKTKRYYLGVKNYVDSKRIIDNKTSDKDGRGKKTFG